MSVSIHLMLLVNYNRVSGATKLPGGTFTAAQYHFKWVREVDIVFEGQWGSWGWLSGKFSLCRACSSQEHGEI